MRRGGRGSSHASNSLGVALRVNVDSSIRSDPRFDMMAAELGIPVQHLYGCMLVLWMACYARKSPRIYPQEADQCAGLPGFFKLLLKYDLAEDAGEQLRVRGVEERIKYLQSAAERGQQGGVRSGISRRKGSGSNSFKQSEATLNPPSPSPVLSLKRAPLEATASSNASEPDRIGYSEAKAVIEGFLSRKVSDPSGTGGA